LKDRTIATMRPATAAKYIRYRINLSSLDIDLWFSSTRLKRFSLLKSN
jgi:hypothetical protein